MFFSLKNYMTCINFPTIFLSYKWNTNCFIINCIIKSSLEYMENGCKMKVYKSVSISSITIYKRNWLMKRSGIKHDVLSFSLSKTLLFLTIPFFNNPMINYYAIPARCMLRLNWRYILPKSNNIHVYHFQTSAIFC